MRLFVFGLGYSARAAVERMRPRLEAICGTTRDSGKFPAIHAMGVSPLLFDGGSLQQATEAPSHPAPNAAPQQVVPDLLHQGRNEERLPSPMWGGDGGGVAPTDRGLDRALLTALANSDHILVSIAPDESGDPVLNHFRSDLAASEPKSLVYLSTIGVYGDHDGAWVDEASPCRPVSKRSRQRVEAEAAWRRFAEETGVPVAMIRLAGIYGPGRGPFEKIRCRTARRIIKPGQVFNRIHVDDIAAIVEAAFLRRADAAFNGTDDEPAPPQQVLAYAAELLGVPPPPELAYEAAELSPMARSFYGENKRVRNDKIKAELGVRLRYPDYREGLRAVLQDERESFTLPFGEGVAKGNR